MSRKISDEQIDDIIRLFDEGKSYVEIGKIVGCSNVTVKSWLVRHDTDLNKYNASKPTMSDEEIVQKYRDGVSISELAKTADTYRNKIYGILKNSDTDLGAEDISIAYPQGITEDIARKIVGEYGNGKSITKISEETGVCRRKISGFLRKNNIEITTRKKTSTMVQSEIVEKYDRGMTAKDISVEYGIGANTVFNILREKTVLKGKHLPDDVEMDVVSKYEDGFRMSDIARELGVGIGRVLSSLKRHGITFTDRTTTKEKQKWIVDEYLGGRNIAEIRSETGISRTAITNALIRSGVKIRNNTIQQNEIEEIVSRYVGGDSCRRVGDDTGHTDETIRRVLEREGVERRLPRISDEESATIIKLYLSGSNCHQIAREVCRYPSTIRRILIVSGVKIRPFIGNNCPSWKGGVSKDNNIVRHTDNSKNWRNSLFELNKYRSEISGDGGALNCHHIVPLSKILRSSRIKHSCLSDEQKRLAIIGDERFYDEDNGLVVTKEEHRLIEKSPRDSHPWWKIWRAFPEFATDNARLSEEQFKLFNEKGQIDPSNSILERSDKRSVENIIRYEHYLGTVPSSKLILKTSVSGIVTGIATFGLGANRHLSKGGTRWELTRLCVPFYVVRPFTIDFLHMCCEYIRTHFPEIEELVSFADTSVGHDGAVYRMAGWKKAGKTGSSYAYWNPETFQLVHKSSCRRIKGVDKTEKELAIERGLEKIPLPPKRRYVWCINY